MNAKTQSVVQNLRVAYRNGRLNEDEIARLEAIGFDFLGRIERLRLEREPLLTYVRDNPNAHTVPELARMFGISRHKCYALLYYHDCIDLAKPSRNYSYAKDVPAILADYDAGMPRRSICSKYSISDTVLKKILNRNNRHRLKQVDEEMRDVIVHLRKEGRTRFEIAKAVGVKPATVSVVLREEGLPFIPSKLSEQQRGQVVALIKRGNMTYSEIGKCCGVSAASVGAIARELGVFIGNRTRKCRCIETGEIFASMKAAQQSVAPNSVNGSRVVNACKTGKTYHGYHWEYVGGE